MISKLIVGPQHEEEDDVGGWEGKYSPGTGGF